MSPLQQANSKPNYEPNARNYRSQIMAYVKMYRIRA